MRPAEFNDEVIITAGKLLLEAGRNVTGFALRQKIGGGNPTRLKQIWDEHLAGANIEQNAPVAELPIEVAETVANETKLLTERIAALAVELNDKAIKNAERRVAEVLRTASEQREQAQRELVDAAATVDDLEAALDDAKGSVESLTETLAQTQIQNQDQAVEIAQLRERLIAADSTASTLADQNKAELTRCSETIKDLNANLAAQQKESAQKLEQLRNELTEAKQAAATALQQAKDEAKDHQRVADQHKVDLVQAKAELSNATEGMAKAREEAARLLGQIEAIEAQRAELLKVITEKPVVESEPPK